MTNVSPIKLKNLVEQNKKMDVMDFFETNAETKEGIKYYKTFKKEKVDELLKELLEDIQYTVEQEIELFNDDDKFQSHVLLLIIKHFSHFKSEIGISLQDKKQAFDALYNMGYFGLFFSEIFSTEEVTKVFKSIDESFNKLTDIVNEELEAISNSQKTEDDLEQPEEKKTTVRKTRAKKKETLN